ncbi:MAG: hypothetical protein PHV77_02125 [Candidatus Omnitrophica bacterium]|jgi:hypothetical protein|nr:hypothetical protein [Candidatus Omnitrophota bacterium]
MKKIITGIILSFLIAQAYCGISYAGSNKTWGNIGKGLAIYEGVKVVTGRQGNIIDDVTGGMQPRQASSQVSGSTDSYETGYNAGYEAGYNAGFRQGVERSGK